VRDAFGEDIWGQLERGLKLPRTLPSPSPCTTFTPRTTPTPFLGVFYSCIHYILAGQRVVGDGQFYGFKAFDLVADAGGQGGQGGGAPQQAPRSAPQQQRDSGGFGAPAQSSPAPGGFDDFDDDIPF